MTAQQTFEKLGYTHQKTSDSIIYTYKVPLDSELNVDRTITITFDLLGGYYFIEALTGKRAMIVKLTAPIHYAIDKQVKELGWIEVDLR